MKAYPNLSLAAELLLVENGLQKNEDTTESAENSATSQHQ